MKLISFAIPSYNSQDYLHHCVDTLLSGGDEVEILIINDGSRDNTAAIADDYAAKYPTIVRAIHKENGGHGSGVNRGREEARGLYYKVVDSDDWVDEDALKTLLHTIKNTWKKINCRICTSPILSTTMFMTIPALSAAGRSSSP